ncbi:hypothetical protein F53441_9506 [Fusarium austroafricanum]|uniref:Uncharacterized protein n=1 Tax=Fusarium austroafricanum TaxID=2364996 RepID=A0A8H4K901_9HYPO|nr:hypothetical protein F53441_9506 [Fusarium austroafricanum]
MSPNPPSTPVTAIRDQSKSKPLSYTTFYSPSWTAFQGTTTQLGPQPDNIQYQPPDRNTSIQSAATAATSSGTTSYSDYSTPPVGYGLLASRTKQEKN